MKRRIAWILILALLSALMPTIAIADGAAATRYGTQVVRNDQLAAYLDGQGNLFIAGGAGRVNQQYTATTLVSIDAYRIVFFSDDSSLNRRLVSLDLTSQREELIAQNVYAAYTDGDLLYYIPASDRYRVAAYSFDTRTSEDVYQAVEQLDRIYKSADGLVITYVEGAGAVSYSSATQSFVPVSVASVSSTQMLGDCQLYTAQGKLYLRKPSRFTADQVDENVLDFTVLNGKVYYMTSAAGGLTIKVYDPDSSNKRTLSTPSIALVPHITASASSLFALGSDNKVYRIDPANGALTPFCDVQAPKLTSGKSVGSYRIEAMSGQLNVYANLQDANTLSFSFIDFSTDTASASEDVRLVQTTPISGESLAWTTLQPAAQYSTLARGSRGDAVRVLQQPLYDLGYYDYYVDGIYGWRTEAAVSMVQDDLGLKVNGVADAELQKKLLGGGVSPYDPYLQLARGKRGLRVTRMQQRLRDLGYLADGADGIYGPRTQAAVSLFQQQNNLPVSGTATRETLKALYAETASVCSTYIDLRRGDSGWRVYALNQRLRDLFYLAENPGDCYSQATVEAVRLFQSQTGLTINGVASSTVQQRLFSDYAPEFRGYVELRRGDSNDRVTRLQQRLKELGYFNGRPTGYFGSETERAVKLFEAQTGFYPNGVATVPVQELLFSPYAPYYVRPTYITSPAITLSAYERFEDGVYLLTDGCSITGNAIFAWDVEGEVAEFGIDITDDTGKSYFTQRTEARVTSVSIAALVLDRTYTLKVTAYPADGNKAHITSNSVRFRHIETPVTPETKPGSIIEVGATAEVAIRTEEGVTYVKPGTITLRWYAVGELDHYVIELRDGSNNAILHRSTTDVSATIASENLHMGETYTLEVSAIPTNGTFDDRSSVTKQFVIEQPVDPIPTVTAPEVTADGLTLVDGAYEIEAGTPVTFRWNAVEHASQYYIEVRDSGNAFFTDDTTTATGYVLNTSAMTQGSEYKVSVTAIPEGGTPADGATTEVVLRTGKAPESITLSAPTVTVDGVLPSEDGAYHFDGDSAVLRWNAVEGAHGYNVVLRDAAGVICAQVTVDEQAYSLQASSLTRGAVYSATISAIPADNAENVVAATTTLQLTFDMPPVDEKEENSILTQEMTDVAMTPAVFAISETNVIDDVAYVLGESAVFGWHADGATAYEVTLTDEAGTVVARQETAEEAMSFPTEILAGDEIYVFSVSANESAAASMLIGRATSDTSGVVDVDPTQEPIEAPTMEPVEPTQTPEPAPDSVEPETTQEPTEEPTEAPTPEAPVETEAPTAEPELLPPALDAQPSFVADGVYRLNGSIVEFSWASPSGAQSYRVEITDANGAVMIAQEFTTTGAQLATSNLQPGMIYRMAVTVSDAYGQTAASEMLFGLPEGETEPTEAPIEEPTEAPIEEPTEAPAEEPTEAPIEEPTEAPAEEPTEVPFEEPTEVPFEEPTEAPVEEPIPLDPPTIGVSPSVENDGVQDVGDGMMTFTWFAENAAAYHVVILNEAGQALVDQTMPGSAAELPSQNLTPGEIYTLEVTALAGDGEHLDSETASILFRLPVAAEPVHEPDPTEEPVYSEPDPTEAPVFEPDPTEEPVYAEPEPEPFVEPEPVGTPVLAVDPSYDDGGIATVQGDWANFHWHADGDVRAYLVEIMDAYGNTMVSQEMNAETAQLPASNLTMGMVYTLRVTALPGPNAGEESAVAEMHFQREVLQQEPDPTEAPYIPEPEPEYEPEPEPEYIPEPEPEYEPEPEPEYEPEPEPEYVPEPEPEPYVEPATNAVDPNAPASEEDIKLVQQTLTTWGWIDPTLPMEIGKMDALTLEAVNRFLTAFNTQFAQNNPLLVPEQPVLTKGVVQLIVENAQFVQPVPAE